MMVSERLLDNNKRVQVWGEVTAPIEQLLSGLSKWGWRPEPRGWPQPSGGVEWQGDSTNLIALDGDSRDHLSGLQSILRDSGRSWVFVCGPQDLDRDVVRAMLANSAYAYQCLPGDPQELDMLLRHARMMDSLWAMAPLHPDQPLVDMDNHPEDEMVGTTPAMFDLFKAIRRLAAVGAPVLVRGESGTGKELAARAIHDHSERADKPFVAINCGALPPELIQSELFGYEKGAFTGATRRHIGHVEAASGGTLLLDEIGDLPLSLQVHLLRFLETGRIQRVGGTEEVPVDVRVLSATHVALEEAIADGRFREDLYHRLNVVSLRLPPLRERTADIEVLARFFFQRFAADRGANVRGISNEALLRLCQHDWPGNVRELINRMRRAMVMCEGRLIGPADLGLEGEPSSQEVLTLKAARARAECKQIRAALTRNRYTITAAAKELGVSRVTLYRLIDKHHLNDWLRSAADTPE